ncbi:MAG TPA: TIGR04282 family arsenosugar biosynthesis glycosyltransferase, partial [Ktedonobacteraceae bacterium]|nr:TIGR04282 family arsenosugar biosynthesis glycosyltransferase [Ktedonobacteraceae bacterium]
MPDNIATAADTALIIVARYPLPGTTKTRLARAIGDDATIQLYTAFLTDLALKFGRPEGGANGADGADGAYRAYDLHWAYTPAGVDFAALLSSLVPRSLPPMRSFPQQGEGLGERLLSAFRHVHEQGYRRAILIGSDSPHVPPAIVSKARAALDDADIVLGPAEDGGYYLIAMQQPYDVFRDIPMSTDKVLSMTIDLAVQQGLRVRTLETLFDV